MHNNAKRSSRFYGRNRKFNQKKTNMQFWVPAVVGKHTFKATLICCLQSILFASRQQTGGSLPGCSPKKSNFKKLYLFCFQLTNYH